MFAFKSQEASGLPVGLVFLKKIGLSLTINGLLGKCSDSFQNVRISIPLFNTLYNAVQKCLELQILYDFIKKKNWHAADEYCSHTMTNNNNNNNNEEEQQLSPPPSSTNHLITILNMVKKEYSYLQMQNKHHVYKNKSNITTISVSSTATTTSSMQHERLQPELINILKDVTIEEKNMESK